MFKRMILSLFILSGILSAQAGIHRRENAEPFTLQNITISVPAEFAPASTVLQTMLKKVCKIDAPVSTNGNIVFVKDDKLPAQGFSIVTGSSGIRISAADIAGAKYAVAFLAHELGYRHFFPAAEWEIIPDTPPASISLNITESPDYLSRSIWPGWGIWQDYRKATRFDEMWKLFNFQGGITIKCTHVYGRFVKHRKKVFDQHPEYYGLLKGKRTSNKLCISNPELRKLFTDYKLEMLKNNPDQESVSAEPSDGGGWCECENCKKIGSASTRAVFLANETAQAVSTKYPGKMVGMYAYNQHSLPPEIDLHNAVVVNIATAFIKGGYTVDQLIAAWKKRKANVGIREYYFAGIVPGSGNGSNTAYMKESLCRFYQNGARYITAEAGDYWGPGGLGFYSGARMMWNTSLTPADLKEDFLRKAFPASYEPMKEFYSLLDGAAPRPLNADLLGRMYRNLGAAKKIASQQEQPRIAALICYTRFCELYFKLLNTGKWEDYRTLMHFGASIRATRMVHTYGMFRSPRRVCPSGMLNKKLDVNWMNTPPPTAADLDKFVSGGIKNNKLLDFKVKNFSNDLVVLNNPKGVSAVNAGNSRWQIYYYLWSDGKPFTVEVTGGLIKHYRNRGNVILQLVQVGGESDTGELETAVHYDRSVPPDGVPRKVVLKPKHPGLHKLVVNDNGDMTRINWPTDMAVARPVEREKAPELNGTFYFYVPHGTTLIGFYAKTKRGSIISPSGKTIRRLNKSNGYYSFKVTPEQCGKVWKISNMLGTIKFLTIPSNLSLKSSKILIPKEVKGK